MAYDHELADRIREVLADQSGVEEKQMFGGLAFLINGNMAVSASGQGGLLLRVEPSQTAELAERAHAERFVMRDKAMDGWLRVAPEGVRTMRDLRRWTAIGVDFATSLPAKSAKPRRARRS